MRTAHLFIPAALLLTVGVSSAQPLQAPPDPLDAGAPSLPLIHQPLAPSTAMVTDASGMADWRQANAEVAEFPRGHADLVRWEARQPAGKQPLPGSASPHHGHGGTP